MFLTYAEVIKQQIAANQELYLEHGCETREEYLKQLADDNGLPLDVVQSLADVLGPTEDFDGLVNACEDAADSDWDN